MGVLLVTFAATLACACAFLASAQVAAVVRSTPRELAALRAVMRRLPREERVTAIVEHEASSTWLGALGSVLGDAASPAERAAAANEVLGDLEGSIEARASWPAAAVRLAAFGGLLLVAMGLLAQVGAVVVTSIVGLTGVTTIVAGLLGRHARLRSSALREAADDIVSLCVPPAEREEPGDRAPRRGRRGARRR